MRPIPALRRVSMGLETTEPCKMSNRPHPASRRWTVGLTTRRPNLGTIGVKPMGAVFCIEFACSCQTGAPPTQGQAGAKSHSIWWQPMHRMLRRRLRRGRTPHEQWTQGMWVKMSPAERTYFNNHPRLPPLINVILMRFCSTVVESQSGLFHKADWSG